MAAALLVGLASGFSPSPASLRARAPTTMKGVVSMAAKVSTSISFGHVNVQTVEHLKVNIKDCLTQGVGIGLDPDNVIDMLWPGNAAVRDLKMGDTVLTWNGIALKDPATGLQRTLSMVVDRNLDTHTLTLARSLKPLTAADAQRLSEEALQRSQAVEDDAIYLFNPNLRPTIPVTRTNSFVFGEAIPREADDDAIYLFNPNLR